MELDNATKIVPLQTMIHLYNTQDDYIRTPVSDQFWSMENLTWLVAKITSIIEEKAGFAIEFLVDDVFFLMAAKRVTAAEYTSDVSAVVAALNFAVTKETVAVRMREIKRRKLFLKTYIFQDHEWYVAPARNTHGRHRYHPISSERYTMGDPDQRRMAEFQAHQNSITYRAPALFDIYY
jgi:hypothetical protein